MSLSLAQKNAWSLAKSLMVCITLFKADMGYVRHGRDGFAQAWLKARGAGWAADLARTLPEELAP